jgi:hypothetical protein
MRIGCNPVGRSSISQIGDPKWIDCAAPRNSVHISRPEKFKLAFEPLDMVSLLGYQCLHRLQGIN